MPPLGVLAWLLLAAAGAVPLCDYDKINVSWGEYQTKIPTGCSAACRQQSHESKYCTVYASVGQMRFPAVQY